MNKNLLLSPIFINIYTKNKVLTEVMMISVGVVFMALLAQIKFYLWFTPVPITGQTLGFSLIGLVYGARLGFSTLFSYLVVGTFGVPVFAGGSSGFFLNSASGGYLIGMVFAATLIGYLSERGWSKSYLYIFIALLLGSVLNYVPGLIQLSYFIPTTKSVFELGLYPFIAGDLFKMLLVVLLFPSAWKLKEHFVK